MSIQNISNITVTVTVAHSTNTYLTRGFFVTHDGYIVTTLNTIRLNISTGPMSNIVESTNIFVSINGTNDVYKASFVGYNTLCDFALLKINIVSCDFLTLSSCNLNIGENVYTYYNNSYVSGKLLSNYEVSSSLISCVKTDIPFTIDGLPLISSTGLCIGIISKTFNTTLCCGIRGSILESFVSIMTDYDRKQFCCEMECNTITTNNCMDDIHPNIKVMDNGVLQYIIGYVDKNVSIIQNNIVERIKIGDIPTGDMNTLYGCYVTYSSLLFKKGDIITHIDNERIVGTICDLTLNKQPFSTVNFKLCRETKTLLIPYKLVPLDDMYINNNTQSLTPLSHDIIPVVVFNTCVNVIVPITAYVNNTNAVANFTGWIHANINNRLIIITSAHSVLNEQGITPFADTYESFTCDITQAYISKLDGTPSVPSPNKITASLRILGMDIAADICVMYTINPGEQTEIEKFGHFFDSNNPTLSVSTKRLLSGDTIYAISNMYGYGLSMSVGYVEDNEIVYRPDTTLYINQTTQMVTSLPLTGGASGAPVLLYDRNLCRGVLVGMVNWCKKTNSYTGGPNFDTIIKVYIRILKLNMSDDLKILPNRKNFEGKNGKGYLGVEAYIFTDGNVLTELNKRFTTFANSIYSKQCNGCYITKLNTVTNKLPKSGVYNAVNINEQAYINNTIESPAISLKFIQKYDIVLEINGIPLGIGKNEDHMSTISYFSAGKYIYAKVLRPETIEILYFRILCDEYPETYEFVSIDETITLVGKVGDWFRKVFGKAKEVAKPLANELTPYAGFTGGSNTTNTIASAADKIVNGDTADVISGLGTIYNPASAIAGLLTIVGSTVLTGVANASNDKIIGASIYNIVGSTVNTLPISPAPIGITDITVSVVKTIGYVQNSINTP